MKIVQWNISKKNQPLSGVKRYEEELFKNIRIIDQSLDIQRIQRIDNRITRKYIFILALSVFFK